MEVDDNAQSMAVERGSLFSTEPTRSKPVPSNKFQKRLGAKKTKKLELMKGANSHCRPKMRQCIGHCQPSAMILLKIAPT